MFTLRIRLDSTVPEYAGELLPVQEQKVAGSTQEEKGEGRMNEKIIKLALGRIFRILSRPHQDGDIKEYEYCRSIILTLEDTHEATYSPNYARDRLRGAQGD